MRAHATTFPARQEDPHLDISSLIDVSFLLLVFFLVTSTLRRVDTEIGMTEEGRGLATTIAQPMEIGIDAAGTISVDGTPLVADVNSRDVPELRALLTEKQKLATLTGTLVSVLIEANDAAEHQRLVDVLNALGRSKITHFAFAP